MPRKSTSTGAAKKSPAKKTSAKTTPAVKSVAKKAAAKKVAAKKPVAKKAQSAKKAAPAKSAAKKSVASKTAVKKAAAKKTAAKAAASKTAASKTAAPKTNAAKQATAAKKTQAKKPAAPAKPKPAKPKPDRVSGFSAEELAEIRAQLSEEIAGLLGEVSKAESDMADRMRDGVDGAGEDQADQGSKASEREHEISLANNARDLIAQNERAIERIDAGEYGVCESCGGPIGKERLRVFPRATLCVACKQREERR